MFNLWSYSLCVVWPSKNAFWNSWGEPCLQIIGKCINIKTAIRRGSIEVSDYRNKLVCLWSNTLANLSQFFSILSDLKCYRSAFSSSTNRLSNAKPRGLAKKSCKENLFFWVARRDFFIFLHFDPSYFQTS